MEGEATLSETLADPGAPLPDEDALRSLLRKNMQSLMADLEEREREVLKLYFGLDGQPGINLEEISARWGLTRERIRQIKDQALRRLRHPSRINRLKPFQE
jgi:RNA polymerase primary sigma factor